VHESVFMITIGSHRIGSSPLDVLLDSLVVTT
jgi:hypothetical protein